MNDEPLWNADQLAAYLGLTPKTIGRLVTTHPERLPPRVATMKVNRWHPATVRQWAQDNSQRVERPRTGRPRQR